MSKIKQRYEAKVKKETVGLLKSVLKKIESGEWKIKSSGWWEGMKGNYTVKLDVRNSEIPEDSE